MVGQRRRATYGPTVLARASKVLTRMLLLSVLLPIVPSLADPPPVICKEYNRAGTCILWVADPGGPPGGIPEPGGPGDGDPGGGSGGGPNFNSCTYSLASPQPPPSDPVWGGNTPADGAIYLQSCPTSQPDAGDGRTLMFVANGALPGPPVDPRVLAEQAIATMTFLPPPMQTMPPTGSEGAIVGIPVWMWVTPGVTTTGAQTASAAAGGITVTATGSVTQVNWDMGDGTVVTCGIGTAYDGSGNPSPTCGHVYEVKSTKTDPNGVYTLTATSTWTIVWSGGGESGVEVLETSSTSTLRVTEINVLNVPGG